ncbi:MAG: glycosyltransferase family 25 protein [Gammaproteobacteria bacterium]|nr:MAG: glycosyltransferase family 25 protein [Gammaproteobacteria bacterium]
MPAGLWKRSWISCAKSTATRNATGPCWQHPGFGTARNLSASGPRPTQVFWPTSSINPANRPTGATAAAGAGNGNASSTTWHIAPGCRLIEFLNEAGANYGISSFPDEGNINKMTGHKNFKVFVITLPYAVERQKTISKELAELGLKFEFIEGIDGRKLNPATHPNYAPLKRRLFYGRDLSAGELGCLLAHRKIYELILKEKIKYALILEDDALPQIFLPDVLHELSKLASTWDVIRFMGRTKNYNSSKNIFKIPNTNCYLAYQFGIPGGAHAYCINFEAARKLYEATEKSWLAIDTLQGATWITGLRTFAVNPSPVLPNETTPSLIDAQDNSLRWDKTVKLNGWMRLAYPITRGAWKLFLNCWNQCVKAKTLINSQRLSRQLSCSTKSTSHE